MGGKRVALGAAARSDLWRCRSSRMGASDLRRAARHPDSRRSRPESLSKRLGSYPGSRLPHDDCLAPLLTQTSGTIESECERRGSAHAVWSLTRVTFAGKWRIADSVLECTVGRCSEGSLDSWSWQHSDE